MRRIPRKFDYALYDDFLVGGLTDFRVGRLAWSANCSSDPDETIAAHVASVDGHPGCVQLSSNFDAVATYGDAWLSTNSPVAIKDCKRVAVVLKGDAKRANVWDQLQFPIGTGVYQAAFDSGNLDSYPDGCWHTQVRINSVDTLKSTGIPFVADEWYLLEIELDYSSRTIRWFLNGSKVDERIITDATFWATSGWMTPYLYSTHATAYKCVIDELAFQPFDFEDTTLRTPEIADSASKTITHPGQTDTTRVTNLG